MSVKDKLGKRMKENYENCAKTFLSRKVPVAIRIDGKTFRTFTKGFDKPFDEILSNAMIKTMKYLCENVQGCVFGYQQSDEITLILIDYKNLKTNAWFGYEVQKICSITASMATIAFNKFFDQEYLDKLSETGNCNLMHDLARKKGAMFDARCFNIPKEEVCNLIYWRQLDAMRNSIQMLAHTFFSHNELVGLNCASLRNKLLVEKNIDWDNFETKWKHGVSCLKIDDTWQIDYEMPMLKRDNRQYIDKLIFLE